MRRQKRRPMHYCAIGLYDGTVTSAYPTRKPTLKKLKLDKLRIDEDGVYDGYMHAGDGYSEGNNENRFRFQDIIATRLNTRRAIREMVLPALGKLQEDMADIRKQLQTMQQNLTDPHITRGLES